MATHKTWEPGLIAIYPHYSHGEQSFSTGEISTILLKRDSKGAFTWLADDSAGRKGYSDRGRANGNSEEPLWVGTLTEWSSLLARSPTPADLLANIGRKPSKWAPGLVALHLPESDGINSLMMRTEDDRHSWIVYFGEWYAGIDSRAPWHGRSWKRAPEWVGTRAEFDLLRAISPDPDALVANIKRLKEANAQEDEIKVDHTPAILAFLGECGINATSLDWAREMLAEISRDKSAAKADLRRAEAKLSRILDAIEG